MLGRKNNSRASRVVAPVDVAVAVGVDVDVVVDVVVVWGCDCRFRCDKAKPGCNPSGSCGSGAVCIGFDTEPPSIVHVTSVGPCTSNRISQSPASLQKGHFSNPVVLTIWLALTHTHMLSFNHLNKDNPSRCLKQ